MPYARFAALTFAGAYAWCALLIGAGYVVGKEWMLFRDEVMALAEQYAPVGVALAAAAAAGWLVWRSYRSRQSVVRDVIRVEADDHPCREMRRQQPANE
jgi:membrane protein DedA with SNARE-associated domain